MLKKFIKAGVIVLTCLSLGFRTKEYELIEEIKIKNDFQEKIPKDNSYYAVIEIPKINLKKGLYKIDSSKNKVKYGIEIIKEEDGLIILASHSGNAQVSYFKNLNKLEVDDEVIWQTKKQKITYEIAYFYEIAKVGYFEVLNDGIENKIILITCNKLDKAKQIVYVGKIKKLEIISS